MFCLQLSEDDADERALSGHDPRLLEFCLFLSLPLKGYHLLQLEPEQMEHLCHRCMFLPDA